MTNRVPIQQHADPTDHVLLPTMSVACFERGQNPSVVFPSRRQLPVPPSHPLLGSSAPIPNYAVSPPTPAEHEHLRASFLATFSRPLESAPRRVLGNTVLERRSGTFAIPHLASSIPLEGHPLADDLLAALDAPARPGAVAMREAQSPRPRVPEHIRPLERHTTRRKQRRPLRSSPRCGSQGCDPLGAADCAQPVIALRHPPGLHPDHQGIELSGIRYVDQTILLSLCCLSRAIDSKVSATMKDLE